MTSHHMHVAGYGHGHPLDRLVADLCCPRCGYHDPNGSHTGVQDGSLRYFCDSCGAFVTVALTPAQARVLQTWLTDRPMLMVMGVAGSGKSHVGAELARRLELPFREGDYLHSDSNVTNMRAGTPLDDADTSGWMADLAAGIARLRAEGRGGVVACSALKKGYRAALQAGGPPLAFVHLEGDRELIASRLAMRRNRYANPTLLESQLSTLEPLDETETGVTVSGLERSPELIVEEILKRLPGALGLEHEEEK